MKYGIAGANIGPLGEPAAATEIAVAAEAAGFESLWTSEHAILPDVYDSRYPYNRSGRLGQSSSIDLGDPFIWMAWAAAHTRQIKIGTAVRILPEHNVFDEAKVIATLDRLSGGRVLYGVGIGWLREEMEIMGTPWEGRGDRTEEYVGVLREFWSKGCASANGRFLSFPLVHIRPLPVQQPIPVLVGGSSEAAAERAGRVGDGFFPWKVPPDALVPLLDLMRRSADKAGRDPDAIEITINCRDARESVDEYRKLGVHRVVFAAPPSADAIAELGSRLEVTAG